MAEVRIEDVEYALSNSVAGNRELDIYVYMTMHPEQTYYYDSGKYYRNKVLAKNNLLNISPKFTTSWDVCRLLIHESWTYSFFIRNSDCYIRLKTLHNEYQCRTADFPLGICYLTMQISRLEGYDLFSYGEANKKLTSPFISEKDMIMKLVVERQNQERKAVRKEDLVARFKRLKL
jgi:hypothetical protein